MIEGTVHPCWITADGEVIDFVDMKPSEHEPNGVAIPATDYAAFLARATAAEARCKMLEEALTEIARGVLDNENGGDYIDKAYRLAHAALRDARKMGKK